MSEPSDLIEWVHTEASLDEPSFCGERGLCCKILLALNPAVGAESSGSHQGRVGWGEEELSGFHSGGWRQREEKQDWG